MSNLTFQNVPSAFLASESEGNSELPKFISIIDINNKYVQNKPVQNKPVQHKPVQYKAAPKYNHVESATSSAFVDQFGGDAHANTATSSAFIGQFGGDANANTATSSAFIGQLGGGDVNTATSSAFISNFVGGKSRKQNGGNNDVNKLVSMLTSESNLEGVSETTSESLEAQLKEILKQNGGSKKHRENKIQNAGASEAQNIKNFFVNLKSQGVNVNVKLNDKSLSEFFNMEQNTTTDLPKLNGGSVSHVAPTVARVAPTVARVAPTVARVAHNLDGGANAGFEAFLSFKKHVATKLKISNGPAAAKIAGSINADMKKKHSDLTQVSVEEYLPENLKEATRDGAMSLWTHKHGTDAMYLALFRKDIG